MRDRDLASKPCAGRDQLLGLVGLLLLGQAVVGLHWLACLGLVCWAIGLLLLWAVGLRKWVRMGLCWALPWTWARQKEKERGVQ